MKNIVLPLLTIIGLISITACNNGAETDSKKIADSTNTARIDSAKVNDTTPASMNSAPDLKQDAEFAVAAADGGMLEVAVGKLAVKKGKNGVIRKLGAEMVKDHTKANGELKALAAANQIVLPKVLSEKSQKTVSDLQEKTGKDFDKAYADLMVKDHKDVVDLFKKESEKGSDAQLTAWAKSTLPVLDHHLMMSEQAQKTVE